MKTLQKFRAWTGNEMRYDIVGFNWDESFGVYNAWLGNNIEYNADNFLINVLLLQYTGIKDKNGVEIYEGDVVELNVPTYKTTTKTIGDLYDVFALDKNVESTSYIEVIGNVYENPELLEEMED